ncbi:MAG: hypothetical protein AAFR52_05040 [Pseudomonadota bacterium]
MTETRSPSQTILRPTVITASPAARALRLALPAMALVLSACAGGAGGAGGSGGNSFAEAFANPKQVCTKRVSGQEGRGVRLAPRSQCGL